MPTDRVCHGGEDDRQQAGRNQLPERAARQDCAQCDILVVTPLQHGRQGDGAHGHNANGADPAHCCNQSRDEHRAHGEAAGQWSHPFVHGVIEIVCNAGAGKHVGHEQKERHGYQGIVENHAGDLASDQIPTLRPPKKIGGYEGHAAQGEGQWHAHEDKDQKAHKDQGGNGLYVHFNRAHQGAQFFVQD